MKINTSLQLAIAITILCSSVAFSQLPSYVPTTGLLAWYPMNGNGNDVSGTNNNATNNGATFINDRNGVANAAASFNGTTAYMSVATPTFTFTSTGSFSYSFWINKQTQPTAGIVLMTGSNVADNFITLFQGVTNQQFGTNKQQQPWIWATCAHNVNIWTHYVASYNNGAMNLYKNGVLQSSATFNYTGVTSANLPLYIGQGFSGGNFAGSIDDIGVWNRALTQSEVTILYNAITGISDPAVADNFSISPTTDAGIMSIQASNNVVGTAYTIYNALGKKVLNGRINSTSSQLNVSTLPNGIYFYSLLADGKKATTKKMIVAK